MTRPQLSAVAHSAVKGATVTVPVVPPVLLQVTLLEGGMVTVDKRGVVNHMMRGLEYQALGEIVRGIHEFLGELIDLTLTARLLDVREKPVMPEPRRLQ